MEEGNQSGETWRSVVDTATLKKSMPREEEEEEEEECVTNTQKLMGSQICSSPVTRNSATEGVRVKS